MEVSCDLVKPHEIVNEKRLTSFNGNIIFAVTEDCFQLFYCIIYN